MRPYLINKIQLLKSGNSVGVDLSSDVIYHFNNMFINNNVNNAKYTSDNLFYNTTTY